MKGIFVTLLCAFVAVQGRSAGPQRGLANGTPAALGENPWLVHMRIAVSDNDGKLNSCVGTLIDGIWIITTARCFKSATFIWSRYGVVNVVNPELVTESHFSWIYRHPTDDIALLKINSLVVEPTANIKTIDIGVASSNIARVCGWGADENGAPGEQLRCIERDLSNSNIHATRYDVGAPVVEGGVLVGLLQNAEGDIIRPADYLDWINTTTGLSLGGAPDTEQGGNRVKVVGA